MGWHKYGMKIINIHFLRIKIMIIYIQKTFKIKFKK